MAKRNTRKTDPEISSTPESRHAATGDSNGRAAAPKTTRSRRKSDSTTAVPEALAAQIEVPPAAADGAIEKAASPEGTAERQPLAAAPAFTTVAEVAVIGLSHEKIAERAYHLYLERGRQPGDPFADWLTAERELRERFVGA